MSGPKISRYEVSSIQRAKLAEERRRRELELAEQRRRKQLALAEEKRKREEEQKKHRDLLSNVTLYATKVKGELTKAQFHKPVAEEYASAFSDDSLIHELQDIERQAESLLAKLADIDPTFSNKQLEKILSTILSEIEGLYQHSDAFKKHIEAAVPKLQQSLSDSITSLFVQQVSHDTTPPPSNDAEKFTRAYDKIESLLTLEYLPSNLIASLQTSKETLALHRDKGDVESFIAIELQPLIKECESFLKFWQEYGGEYDDLNNMYQVLIDETHSRDEFGDIPFGEHAITQLNQAIAKLQAKAQEEAENAYILRSINEVMGEMGYDILGDRDITKRSGVHFHNELYHFENETAISVTYSDSGQITMELGKIDRCDRIPSQIESERLVAEMSVFCQRFKSVEERLAERGVFLQNRISLLPPAQEFAQIININDYPETTQIRTKRKQNKSHSALHIGAEQ